MSTTQGIRTKLTKALILGGTAIARETVSVPEWGGSVELVSLTEGQWAHVEAMKIQGIGINISDAGMLSRDPKERAAAMSKAMSGVSLDLVSMTRGEREADAQAVAYSMTAAGEEEWTIEDVLSMRPPSIVERLAKVVYALSGVNAEGVRALADFRGDGRGNGNGLPAYAGSADPSDAGADDANAIPVSAEGNPAVAQEDFTVVNDHFRVIGSQS